MAGIFNLFDGIPQTEGVRNQTVKSLARAKTSLGISPAKSMVQSKPKGLSIRSYSDLNVPVTPHPNTLKQNVFNKDLHLLKPKLTQLDNVGMPISPSKKSKQEMKPKYLSPKKEMSSKKPLKLQKPFEESVFKKPMVPRNVLKKSAYPEPEILAPYYDFQAEFDNIYTKTTEDELQEFIMKRQNKIIPYKFEESDSDIELTKLPVKLPTMIQSLEFHNDEWKNNLSPKLPEILSDDDDFCY